MEVLEVFINCRPMPYKRVRGYNGRFVNPINYTKFKKKIGQEIKKQAISQSWIFAPDKSSDLYKKTYLKKARYILSVEILRHKDIGDLSNYIKAIEDAMQDCHIIGDDKLIKHFKNCSFAKIPTKETEGIRIKLERFYI